MTGVFLNRRDSDFGPRRESPIPAGVARVVVNRFISLVNKKTPDS